MTPTEIADMRTRARAAVATWPPFTPEQRDRLYVLLAPMREQLARLAAERANGLRDE